MSRKNSSNRKRNESITSSRNNSSNRKRNESITSSKSRDNTHLEDGQLFSRSRDSFILSYESERKTENCGQKTKRSIFGPIDRVLSKIFVWRGLEHDEWDVRTVATAPSIVNGQPGSAVRPGEIQRTTSLISAEAYKVTSGSSWSCLSGKCGGFFDQFNAPVFVTSTVICLVFIILFGTRPDLAEAWFPPMRESISTYMGWFYILSTDIMLFVSIMIAFTRYGDVKLGDDDSKPEYSFISWVAMLFSAGMGIGLVFYGPAEPLYNYVYPPHDLYGDTDQMRFERAIPLTIFNWGLHAWAVYSILGLAICYFSARLKLPLSIRSALYPLLGSWTLRWPGHMVDVIAVLGTLFGLATSLGIGTIQLNAGLNFLNPNIAVSFQAQSIIIVVITFIAMISVLTGTSKGVKWLSNLNTFLAFILYLTILFIERPGECPEVLGPDELCAAVPPYGSILQNIDGTLQNFGNYWQIFQERAFRTGSYIESEKAWMNGWTIYYMGWFLSWCPFVSAFLAEISRGRTLRQYILTTLMVPLVVTVCWFTVLGLFGMNAQNYWVNPIEYPGLDDAGVTEEAWNSLVEQPLEEMMFLIIQWTRDWGYISTATMNFLSVLTIVVLIIFFISSSDSGCFVITVLACGGNRYPRKWQKIFWVWMCALIALVLMINGGAVALSSLQALVIVTGFPICIMLLLITAGLVKTLQLDPYIVHAPKPEYNQLHTEINIIEMVQGAIRREKEAHQQQLGKNLPKNSLFYTTTHRKGAASPRESMTHRPSPHASPHVHTGQIPEGDGPILNTFELPDLDSLHDPDLSSMSD